MKKLISTLILAIVLFSCSSDEQTISTPTLTTSVASSITQTGATSGGNITSNGGTDITARGVVWSTSQNPTISLTTKTADGTGVGSFSSSLTNLIAGTTYYVKAYATNSAGTAYGNEISIITVPILENGEVFNPVTGKVWMDKNLGASRVAISSTDALAYGDLYQWGRGFDGHQLRNSATTPNLSSIDQPGHGDFILASYEIGWRSPQNNNLWQGTNGVNNPCPNGYRLPTKAEWEEELLSWSSQDAQGAFASPIKLTLAGARFDDDGELFSVNIYGNYWSSTISNNYSNLLLIGLSPNESSIGFAGRARGYSVRCIKN